MSGDEVLTEVNEGMGVQPTMEGQGGNGVKRVGVLELKSTGYFSLFDGVLRRRSERGRRNNIAKESMVPENVESIQIV